MGLTELLFLVCYRHGGESNGLTHFTFLLQRHAAFG